MTGWRLTWDRWEQVRRDDIGLSGVAQRQPVLGL